MKKTVSIILAFIILCSCFIGCGGNKHTDTISTTQMAEIPESTPEDTSNEATTPPEKEEQPIQFADLSKYELIRPDKCSQTVIKAFSDVKSATMDNFGIDLSARTDLYREGVEALKKGDFEILVGETNRDESTAFISGLKRDEFGFAIINGKLIIAGRTDEGTVKAVDKFISAIKLGDRTEIFFDNNNDKFIHTVKYDADDVKINGISVFEYILVYTAANKNTEKELAENFRENVADICGAYPAIVSDSKADTSKPMVIFGDSILIDSEMKSAYSSAMESAKEWQYYTASKDRLVWVNAPDNKGLTAAVAEISSKIDKTHTDVSISTETKTATVSESISVMSYNVWYKTPSDRKSNVLQLIHEYSPDLLGVQEATHSWINILDADLKTHNYSFVGEGRDGGTGGEYNAIFYRNDKFNLIESGTKWLSDTPNKKGSTAVSGVLPRIMTYAVLERKSDGLRFIYVNTHLDHTSDSVRIKQITVLMSEIAMLPDLPLIMTGDFNTNDNQTPYKELISYGLFDGAKVAAQSDERDTGTFHGYSSGTPQRIDFIFGTPGNILFDTYEVGNKQINGNYPSDHHPVYSDIYLFNK